MGIECGGMPLHPFCQPKLPLLWILLCLSFVFITGFSGPRLVDNDAVPARRLSVGQLRAAAEAQQLPPLSAKAFLVYDVDAEKILFARASNQALPPASLTKLMTALLVLEAGNLDAPVTVRADALIGDATMGLRAGEVRTVVDLLYGLLIPSGNDAAMALARHTAGSVDAFVARMNERAVELGLAQTTFANPHGLDAENHLSSAADILTLTRRNLEYPLFREIVSQASITVGGHPLRNTNRLLGTLAGADGVKTGTTDLAGQCLVASVTRDGHRLLIVILGSRDRYADARALYAVYDASFAWAQGDPNALSVLNRVTGGDGTLWYLGAQDPAPEFLLHQWGMHGLEPYRRLQLPTTADLWQPGMPVGVIEWRLGNLLVGTQTLVFR